MTILLIIANCVLYAVVEQLPDIGWFDWSAFYVGVVVSALLLHIKNIKEQ